MKRSISIYKVLGLLALLTFVVACSEGPQIYPKIKGWSTIDNRFSEAKRNNTSYALIGNFNFQNRKVKLPYSVYNIKKSKIISFDRQIKEYGNWEFISRKPDSILIEDPKDFFSGRYGVEFGIARSIPGSHHPDTLWVLLSNDSTHIVLNKLSSAVSTQLYKKWLESETEAGSR